MIIFIDVDDVCADLMPAWLDKYNKDYDDTLKPQDVKSWKVQEFVKKECGDHIYNYLRDGKLYDDVKPVYGALNGVNLLRDLGHHIVFASAGIDNSGRKYQWLVDHGFVKPSFAKKEFVGVGDKGLLRGDILVDDGPHNIDAFDGFGILVRRPHNMSYEYEMDANSWLDICNMVKRIHSLGV